MRSNDALVLHGGSAASPSAAAAASQRVPRHACALPGLAPSGSD